MRTRRSRRRPEQAHHHQQPPPLRGHPRRGSRAQSNTSTALRSSLAAPTALLELPLLASVRHAHCAPVRALLAHGSALFLCVPFQPLGSWDVLLRSQPTDRASRHELLLRFALQTVAGMAYLHSRRVAHCNLKPSNVLVTPGHGVAITDYGLSHILPPEIQQARAHGPSAAYLAPEARRLMAGAAGGELTPQADVYSFGVMLAQALLRGDSPTHPAEGGGGDGAAPYAMDRVEAADAPAGLAALVRGCLSREPAARPRFDALLLELEAQAKAYCAGQ